MKIAVTTHKQRVTAVTSVVVKENKYMTKDGCVIMC